MNAWQATVIKGNAAELAALANSTEVCQNSATACFRTRLTNIYPIHGRQVQTKGVDSVGSGFADPAAFVRSLARKERTLSFRYIDPAECDTDRRFPSSHFNTGAIVVLTGVKDYVSDGTTVIRLSNGHPLLGEITGSGCMVGTAVATFCAGASMAEADKRAADVPEDAKLVRGDMLVAAVGG